LLSYLTKSSDTFAGSSLDFFASVMYFPFGWTFPRSGRWETLLSVLRFQSALSLARPASLSVIDGVKVASSKIWFLTKKGLPKVSGLEVHRKQEGGAVVP
jgi:hypothetical protein